MQKINRKRDRRKPSWFGSEKERRFWGFPMRQKAGPVGTGDDRQRGSGGNARQWFWREKGCGAREREGESKF